MLDVVVKVGILSFQGFLIASFDRGTFWFFGGQRNKRSTEWFASKNSQSPLRGKKALWAKEDTSCSRGRKPANWKLAKSRGHSTPQRV
jgi:hypothetical protein